jgi:DNA-3-methyladenine glycosylase I
MPASLEKPRCAWLTPDPLYVRYHDEEWGRPVHGDDLLFECLTLEGAQAGLSWLTVLRKREHYRKAFAGFDPARVARFQSRKVDTLMQNEGLVRHRQKLESTLGNARALLALQDELGSFDHFIWSFVGHAPKVNRPATPADVPSRTPESDALSRALKRRGFTFVGSTICYAFMQACGLVDDHLQGCFCCQKQP